MHAAGGGSQLKTSPKSDAAVRLQLRYNCVRELASDGVPSHLFEKSRKEPEGFKSLEKSGRDSATTICCGLSALRRWDRHVKSQRIGSGLRSRKAVLRSWRCREDLARRYDGTGVVNHNAVCRMD